jgi:hypothetical protein
VLKEAQAEDNKTGLMYCYNIMSQIYTIKNFDVMASEWRVKEIELTEKYKLENYNISNTYAQLANYASSAGTSAGSTGKSSKNSQLRQP